MAARGALMVALAALALPATGAAPSAVWRAGDGDGGPLLGLVFEGSGWRLARVEHDSLEAAGRRVYVGRSSGSWAFSPDRSLLAVSAETVTGQSVVRILDPATLAQRATAKLTYDAGAVAWPRPRRVVAVSAGYGTVEVLAYDPAARRVLRRTKVGGYVLRTARTPDGLALLLAPADDGMGPARLAVVGADGRVRTAQLRIVAGWTQPDGEPYVFEQRLPGLAVDAEGGRAFVVPAGRSLLEVELATLAVRERALSEPVSLFGRLGGWLEPEAQAKASNGPVRRAVWLGNGLLAVSGSDALATVSGRRIERQELRPAGLTLVDTTTWTVRTADERASGFVFADGLLLATGEGVGLAAYGPYGDLRFSLFAGRHPWVSLVFGGRAYVGFGGGPGQELAVVDLASGGVVGTRAGITPQLLLGAADAWYG